MMAKKTHLVCRPCGYGVTISDLGAAVVECYVCGEELARGSIVPKKAAPAKTKAAKKLPAKKAAPKKAVAKKPAAKKAAPKKKK